ncbi:MAG: RidA family protein [Alphaproteobacteria bacterium]|nr:RidA family protein [Alphaproteobacteria bacterium]MBU0835387.1 RidA family protein [Alphaproteobacteria bacterium]MBU1765774.1 RidA family protein [Alphaproteobacteria bacterium]
MNVEQTQPTPEARLKSLGLLLPQAAPAPIGAFRNLRIDRGTVYVSGQGPVRPDGTLIRGRVGDEITAQDATDHARLVGLNMLAVLRDEFGTLDRIAGVVKLLGFVNAVPGFERHPEVIDGASRLMHDVFGEGGIHARSSLGVASLPNNIPVEIEGIFELKP